MLLLPTDILLSLNTHVTWNFSGQQFENNRQDCTIVYFILYIYIYTCSIQRYLLVDNENIFCITVPIQDIIVKDNQN